jgi:hypothetical protein
MSELFYYTQANDEREDVARETRDTQPGVGITAKNAIGAFARDAVEVAA